MDCAYCSLNRPLFLIHTFPLNLTFLAVRTYSCQHHHWYSRLWLLSTTLDHLHNFNWEMTMHFSTSTTTWESTFLDNASAATFSTAFLYWISKLNYISLVKSLCWSVVVIFWSHKNIKLKWSILTINCCGCQVVPQFFHNLQQSNQLFLIRILPLILFYSMIDLGRLQVSCLALILHLFQCCKHPLLR